MTTQEATRPRGDKPTKAEQESRQDFVLDMLVRGYRKGEIKKACAAKFSMAPRSVERYLRRARDMLLEGTETERPMLIAQSRETYLRTIRDPKASHADKVRAQLCLDKLLGLQAPRRLAHEGADGGPIQVEGKPAASVIMGDPKLHEQAQQLALEAARALSVEGAGDGGAG